MDQLKLIYSFRPLRLTIKFSVCMLGVKMLGDLFYAVLSGVPLTYPRFTFSQQGAQHPLNPPIPFPYPVERQAKHLDDIYKFDQYHQKIMETLYLRKYLMEKIYKNKPARENPDQIDQFMQYCEASRILDGVYSKVLRKMKDSGSEIPEGINQKIRELSQIHLDRSSSKILPFL